MAETVDYADLPIDTPDQDLFGVDPFVQALAKSIRQMKMPNGAVIALNGAWGSGKSSAVNLLKHHLKDISGPEGELRIMTFNPWWFRGEEALVLAFFRELYTATEPSLSAKAKKTLPKLGAKLLKAGGVVSASLDVFGAAGAGSIAGGTMDFLAGLIEGGGDSVEKLHADLSKALGEQNKRFLVVIDDLDRLAPDELMAMFRLVKSVGRLPNVIYLLAFDRLLAEKVVTEHFPSEGHHYLEKIVQAAFDLPTPSPTALRDHLLGKILELTGHEPHQVTVNFMNLFSEIVAPEIRMPRDSVRYVNALSVTWPAVAGEVHLPDFLALEAYRLLQPTIYQAIRQNSALITGTSSWGGSSKITHEQLDQRLLPAIKDTMRYRRGLMRLFPRLESIWSNTHHTNELAWIQQRRVCSREHFPIYFQLSLSDDVISAAEIKAWIKNAGDAKWIMEATSTAVATPLRGGGTKAAALLESLKAHASDFSIEKSASLLTALFMVADKINVEADKPGAFEMIDNSTRLHHLLRAMLWERTTLPQRSKILMKAAKSASLSWLVDFTRSAWDDYHPGAGKAVEDEARCLVTETDAERLSGRSLKAIQKAAKDGSLLQHPDLLMLLHQWSGFAGDAVKATRKWTAAQLKSDGAVVRLASAFTGHSWSSGLGDLAAQRHDRVRLDGMATVIDPAKFRARARAVAKTMTADSPDLEVLDRFLRAWDRHDEDPRA